MDEPEINLDKAQALKALAEAKQIEADTQIKKINQKLKIVNDSLKWLLLTGTLFGLIELPIGKEVIKWATNF